MVSKSEGTIICRIGQRSVTHVGGGFHASTQPTAILYLIPPTYLEAWLVSRNLYAKKAPCERGFSIHLPNCLAI